jgi:hypothetical protein
MPRTPNSRRDGSRFDRDTIEAVWQKGTPEPSYQSFRKDTCGASMKRSAYGTTDTFGWEIDHIKPVAAGGGDELANLQPLHWENNRHKADNWPDWECKRRF